MYKAWYSIVLWATVYFEQIPSLYTLSSFCKYSVGHKHRLLFSLLVTFAKKKKEKKNSSAQMLKIHYKGTMKEDSDMVVYSTVGV